MKLGVIFILGLLFLGACENAANLDNYPIIKKSRDRLANKEDILYPIASNELVRSNDIVTIDYSNTNYGYIMLKTNMTNHKRLKLRISKDNNEYTYDIPKEEVYISYPLTFNDGIYNIKIFENVNDNNYALIENFDIKVKLDDDKYPYLYPNVIVDYDIKTKAINKAYELCAEVNTDIERVFKVYKWIIENIDYDYDKVEEVSNKYVLPIIDEVLEAKKGICFDYAALMSCMLRVLNIPTKLVTGYVDRGYHAWVEVYIEDIGWINPDIYFENKDYVLIDPTYDSMPGDKYKGPYEDLYKY